MECTARTRHEYVTRLESRFWGQHQPRRKCLDFFRYKLVAPNGAHLENGALTCRWQAILGSGTLARFNRQQDVASSNSSGYLAFEVAYQDFPRLAGGSDDPGCAEAYVVDRCREVDDAPLLGKGWEHDRHLKKLTRVHALPSLHGAGRAVSHLVPEIRLLAHQAHVLRKQPRFVQGECRELRRRHVPIELSWDNGDGTFPRGELPHHQLTSTQPMQDRIVGVGPIDRVPFQDPLTGIENAGDLVHLS